MKKKYRLRKKKEFGYTYKKGKSIANYCLVLVYRQTYSEITRVGFSISKKFGKAVKRNKIKRQLREIYRKKIDSVKTGYDLIFIVRKGAKEADYKKLDQAVDNLLKRAGLLK